MRSSKSSKSFKLFKSSKSSKLFKSFEKSSLESSKIYSKSSRVFRNQILNEMNDLNSKYFESSQTFPSTSANITHAARIFSENSIQNLITNEFDQSIEKIDFILKKSISQLINRSIFRQISQSKIQAQTMTFVSKNAKLNCISKYDISNDLNIQMLNISSNVENFIISMFIMKNLKTTIRVI